MQTLRSRAEEKERELERIVPLLEELEQEEAKRHAAVTEIPRVEVREKSPYEQRGIAGFFSDVLAAHRGDSEARERLAKVALDEARSRGADFEKRVTTAAQMGGFMVPQHLVDLYAPPARPKRPFADALEPMPLPPEGTTVVIPRVTTGAATGSNETSIRTQDLSVVNASVPVVQVQGRLPFSKLAVDRGSISFELAFRDLLDAYDSELDRQLISGNGGEEHTGVLQLSGTNAVTYTDTTPTASELYRKVLDAVQRVESQAFFADLIVLHPRRWAWLRAESDTSGRPLFPGTPDRVNAAGDSSGSGYGVGVGTIGGVPVVTDANVPTNLGAGANEDAIIVVSRREIPLMEDAGGPFFVEIQDGSNIVNFIIWGYSAFAAARRPTAISVITGTGLVTPSF